MDDLLIGLGLILFVVGIIMLVVSFIKKTKKKKALLFILIGFIVCIIGGTFVDTDVSTNNSSNVTSSAENISEKSPDDKTYKVVSEQDAINAVKEYANEQGYSEIYDKFNVSKEDNTYFIMAGFSYLGDSWEGSADMYEIDMTDGTVALRLNPDDVENTLTYENSDFAKLNIDSNTWYLEDLENAGSFMPINFKITPDGIVTNIEFMYGVMKLDVLCTLDSTSHASGYDDGSGIGGLAKYTGEFEEGTELYIKLLVKDSELYLAMHHENEKPEYQKLLNDKAMDIHNAMMESIY